MIQAIVFDFDGVLVDSVEIKTEAFRKLFAGESAADIKRIVRYHLRNGGISRYQKIRAIYKTILKRPLTEAQFKAHCRTFGRLVVDEVMRAPSVPGAKEFLLRNRGRRLCFIVSGTPTAELRVIARRRGLHALFKDILGAPRSKETLLNKLMHQYRLSANEIVFIGDAESDWKAARATGIPFILRHSPQTCPRPKRFAGISTRDLRPLEKIIAGLQA